MIYVGGNDGMLHGFSAQDGTEKIAYVPEGVIPSLTRLTAPAYDQQHRYFVDGSPMTGDANTSTDPTSPDWRTLLVGTLGAGGRGYFVLDVTNPAAIFPLITPVAWSYWIAPAAPKSARQTAPLRATARFKLRALPL